MNVANMFKGHQTHFPEEVPKDRLVDTHEKWYCFDGLNPHAAT